MGEDTIEQTLFQAKEVNVYKIPPRPGAGGHKSGDWKVADKILTGRLRVVSIGEDCELRLEEPGSGELFAMCPVPLGQRALAVEPVSDSSRYFVLRLVDATTGRHAFIGMGFADRSDAFDFNVALSDHEKYVQRAGDVEAAAKEPEQATATEAAALYKKQDLSLKEGETIRINVRRATGDNAASSGTGAGFLAGLAPPPPSHGAEGQLRPLAPPAAPSRTPSSSQQASTAGTAAGAGVRPLPPQQAGGAADLLGLGDDAGVAGVTAKLGQSSPFGTGTTTTATEQDSWATFE